MKMGGKASRLWGKGENTYIGPAAGGNSLSGHLKGWRARGK